MTIGEEIRRAAWNQTAEVKTEEDVQRVLNNVRLEAMLFELQAEALRYGYSGDIDAANSTNLLWFIEERKRNDGPALVKIANPEEEERLKKIRAMFGEGFDDKSIAESLNIGERTVRRIRTEVLGLYRRKPRKR